MCTMLLLKQNKASNLYNGLHVFRLLFFLLVKAKIYLSAINMFK